MKVIKYGRLLVLWESGKSSEKMGHLTWGLSRNWPVRYGSGKTSLCIHLLPPRQQWPQDWKRSVFIPIPKKGNAKNAKTTAQLHSSHTLVKQWSKFSKPGFNSTWTVNFQMFKLDLEKVEEPEIKLPDFVDYQKNRTATKKIYFCFIDYAKAFDCVDHHKLWKILKEMGIPDHLTCLLRNLYAGQEAPVRTGHGTTDWFQIGKGVCQGCILSPCLNLYAEYIMRNAGLDET